MKTSHPKLELLMSKVLGFVSKLRGEEKQIAKTMMVNEALHKDVSPRSYSTSKKK